MIPTCSAVASIEPMRTPPVSTFVPRTRISSMEPWSRWSGSTRTSTSSGWSPKGEAARTCDWTIGTTIAGSTSPTPSASRTATRTKNPRKLRTARDMLGAPPPQALRCAPRHTLARCLSRNTAASATSGRPPSRPAAPRRPRRHLPRLVAADSSSSATGRPGCTTTSGSRSTACSSSWAVPEGPDPRPGARDGWPSTSRTTRSSTSTSRASSRRASTAAATSSSGTGARWLPEAETPDGRRAVADGELKFTLEGEKLHGRFTIVRTSGRGTGSGRGSGGNGRCRFEEDGGDQWLLIHKRDDAVGGGLGRRGAPAERQDRPHERRGEGGPRRDLDQPGARRDRRDRPERGEGGEAPVVHPADGRDPHGQAASRDDDWLFEIKWDGYRIEAVVKDGEARIYTRNGNDGETYFPKLLTKATWIDAQEADRRRRGRRVRRGRDAGLQPAPGGDGRRIDPAHLPGLRPAPSRRALAAGRPARGPQGAPQDSSSARPTGECDSRITSSARASLFLEEARQAGPRRRRREAPPLALRARQALAHVAQDQGPARAGAGRRRLDPRRGRGERARRAGRRRTTSARRASRRLRFARQGRLRLHGPDPRKLRERLKDLATDDSPFDPPPPSDYKGRWGGELRNVVWVKPEIVIRAELGGWTRDGIVRQAAFKGFDEGGKPPTEVVRERPVAATETVREVEATMPERNRRRFAAEVRSSAIGGSLKSGPKPTAASKARAKSKAASSPRPRVRVGSDARGARRPRRDDQGRRLVGRRLRAEAHEPRQGSSSSRRPATPSRTARSRARARCRRR